MQNFKYVQFGDVLCQLGTFQMRILSHLIIIFVQTLTPPLTNNLKGRKIHTNTHSNKATLCGHHQDIIKNTVHKVFPFIINESSGSFPNHERYKGNCIASGDNPYFYLGQSVRVIFGNVSWLILMACIFIMSWFYILQPQTDFLQSWGHNHGQFITHQGLLMHFQHNIIHLVK